MFEGCASLTNAPELPVTTLAASCYDSMFANCTSLTQAPELPATTLVGYCYYYMFYNCTALTAAPELPATTLISNCYSGMFYGCVNLNYVKAKFTSWLNQTSWLHQVADAGEFHCPADLPDPSVRGENTVPGGWTIIRDVA